MASRYLFILIGFFGGNLCGSFFFFSLSPFFIIVGIVLCLEFVSYSYYKTLRHMAKKNYSFLKKIKLFYFFKVGFIFGIFVDAFKVGS